MTSGINFVVAGLDAAFAGVAVVVGDQVPELGALRIELADALEFLGIEEDVDFLAGRRHRRQRLVDQRHDLHPLQRQFGADHLARHLGHQVDHFLALGGAVVGAQFLEAFQHGVDRPGQLVVGHQRLVAALLAALFLAGRSARLKTVFGAARQADFITVALALLEALADRGLPLLVVDPVAIAVVARRGGRELRQRRETVGAELLHHSITASANNWISISPESASALTVAMISWRVCSMRDIGIGPARRIMSSKAWAWSFGMVFSTASRIDTSATLSAMAHCSSGTSSMMRVIATSLWVDRMKKSYIDNSSLATISGSWARSSSTIWARFCGSASRIWPARPGGRKARNTACIWTCSLAMYSASHFGEAHCRRAILGRNSSP